MKVLITGARGQVGRALAATAPAKAMVLRAPAAELDITDASAVRALIVAEQPDIIFNAAAYTAVDRAESDEATALRVNGTAVGILAKTAAETGAKLVHISTDFVFDGARSSPYAPDDPTNPLNAYGRTKLAGEQAAGPDALVVRTAWVYAAGAANFVQTMLRLMAERDEVHVVADQIGTPTYATSLAQALWGLALTGCHGIHHFTDSGAASWYDFAVAIQEEARERGLLHRKATVVPIATKDFPTPATRPSYSVLDKQATAAALGRNPPHWRDNLRAMLDELKQDSGVNG